MITSNNARAGSVIFRQERTNVQAQRGYASRSARAIAGRQHNVPHVPVHGRRIAAQADPLDRQDAQAAYTCVFFNGEWEELHKQIVGHFWAEF